MATAVCELAVRAICPHGKVRMLVADRPDILKTAKKELSDCVMEGFTIDRVSVEQARKDGLGDCSECDAIYRNKKK